MRENAIGGTELTASMALAAASPPVGSPLTLDDEDLDILVGLSRSSQTFVYTIQPTGYGDMPVGTFDLSSSSQVGHHQRRIATTTSFMIDLILHSYHTPQASPV